MSALAVPGVEPDLNRFVISLRLGGDGLAGKAALCATAELSAESCVKPLLKETSLPAGVEASASMTSFGQAEAKPIRKK